MITNTSELEIAFHDLQAVEEALELVRKELMETNPSLFPLVSHTYIHRMRSLQSDIFAYLRERPADAPLRVRLTGPGVPQGALKVSILARFLQALQQVVYHEGKIVSASLSDRREPSEPKVLRSLLGLNVIATEVGSFVLALDLAPRQLNLFEDYDLAEKTIVQLFGHLSELSDPHQEFSAGKPLLRSLDQLAALIQPNKIASIDLEYHWQSQRQKASITLPTRKKIDSLLGRPSEGEETVHGTLVSINIERDRCTIRPEGQEVVECGYSDEIEDDLILAIKKQVEVSGIIEGQPDLGQRRRIKHIHRFRIVGEDEAEE